MAAHRLGWLRGMAAHHPLRIIHRSASTVRSVQLNPLYVAAVPRPHLAASIAFGVPLLDRTGTLVDRTRFTVIDPLDNTLKQAAACTRPPPSLHDLMLARAHDLWNEARSRNSELEVLWSGGIDSTAALTAVLRTAPSDAWVRDRLCVKFAPRAVHENAFFYQLLESLPCRKLWITHGQVADAVSDAALTITGEGGDQLFGSSLLQQAFDNGAFALGTPWQEAMRTHLDAKLGPLTTQRGSPLEGFEFGELQEWLAPQLARCPLPIVNAFDLFWWLNFSMKWQVEGLGHVSLRLWTRRKALSRAAVTSTMHHFFMDPRFEAWALWPENHARRKLTDVTDWRSYKAELKEFIFAFDGNVSYRDNKLKIGSLRQHACYIAAIDEGYEVLPGGAQLDTVLDGHGPLLPIYPKPLPRPLVWLSLIMPERVDSRASLRALRSEEKHLTHASVLASTTLDQSEREWLVRVASSQTRASLPSYVADMEILSAQPPPSTSASSRILRMLPKGSILRMLPFASAAAATTVGVRAAAPQLARPRERPLRWPYVSDPAAMGCVLADERHVGSAVAAGHVRVQSDGHRFGRGALRVSITNLLDEMQHLELPMGSILVPDDTGAQTLIAATDTPVFLRPGEQLDLSLEAYCGISSLACPSGQMELTRYLAPRKVCEGQHSVWSWSRSHEPVRSSDDIGLFSWSPWFDERPPASAEHQLLEQEFPEEAEQLQADFGDKERNNAEDAVEQNGRSRADEYGMAWQMSDAKRPQSSSSGEDGSSSSGYDGWFSSGGDSG